MLDAENTPAGPEGAPVRKARRLLVMCGQVAFFILVWLAADFIGRRFGGKIPASVLGMIALLLLLGWGLIEPRHIERGAQLLLAEMLLFFVPAFVGLVNYSGLLGWQGVRLLLMVALGTVMVMAGTAWVVDRVFRWEQSRNRVPEKQP
jgi:holin-like protein